MFQIAGVCHNPYFNRWFSAIVHERVQAKFMISHNPYFNRWFSAIAFKLARTVNVTIVTILILIDGFLQ